MKGWGVFQIPPTKSVDCSYPTYEAPAPKRLFAPANDVMPYWTSVRRRENSIQQLFCRLSLNEPPTSSDFLFSYGVPNL